MPTYLDLLPEDIFRIIFKIVNDRAIEGAMKKARRINLPCFGTKTNNRVIYSWMNGMPWKSLNMRTDGNLLYSYMLKIGHTDLNGEKVVLDYTAKGLGFYSNTTSCHVNRSKSMADIIAYKD